MRRLIEGMGGSLLHWAFGCVRTQLLVRVRMRGDSEERSGCEFLLVVRGKGRKAALGKGVQDH